MFSEIVLQGMLEERGMPNFADRLSAEDVQDIYAFINARSWQDYQAQEAARAGAQKTSQAAQ
jgi:mono/diheme cytochrome c family protein